MTSESMREEIENLIVDTSLHPVEASLRIMQLFDKALKQERQALLEALPEVRLYPVPSADLNMLHERLFS